MEQIMSLIEIYGERGLHSLFFSCASFFVSLLKRERKRFLFWSLIKQQTSCSYTFCSDTISKNSWMTDIFEVLVRYMADKSWDKLFNTHSSWDNRVIRIVFIWECNEVAVKRFYSGFSHDRAFRVSPYISDGMTWFFKRSPDIDIPLFFIKLCQPRIKNLVRSNVFATRRGGQESLFKKFLELFKKTVAEHWSDDFLWKEWMSYPFIIVGETSGSDNNMNMRIPVEVWPECMQHTNNSRTKAPLFSIIQKCIFDRNEKSIKASFAVFQKPVTELLRQGKNQMFVFHIKQLTQGSFYPFVCCHFSTRWTETGFTGMGRFLGRI